MSLNYENIFSLNRPGQTKDDIGPLRTMVAGAVGGASLWTAIFPADVIKSRVQIQGISASMYSVGLDIVRKEGPLGLYEDILLILKIKIVF
jgi:solute carrier family 25 ornithine transporter 2/15